MVAEPDYDALLQEVQGTESDSVLNALSRFLSRPGNAIRALVAGDLPAAGKNLGQMALDFPTGGFLNKNLSLGNLVSDTGDITTPRERYNTESMLRAIGQQIPNSPSQRLALNFAGDVLTDPLTYVTLGGGGVAKGALAHMDEAVAASRLLGAMQGTKAGSALAKGLTSANRIPGLEAALGLARGGLAGLDEAGEAKVIAEGVKRGLIQDNTALRFMGQPVMTNVWGKLGSATAPGLAHAVGKRLAPDATARITKAASEAFNYAGRKFYDNTIAGLNVPFRGALRRGAQEGKIVQGHKAWEFDGYAKEIADLVPEEARREELTRRIYKAGDEFNARAFGKNAAGRKQIQDEIQATLEAGLAENEVMAVRKHQEAMAKARTDLRKAKVLREGKPIWDAEDGAADFVAARDAAARRVEELQLSGLGSGDKEFRQAKRALKRANRDLKSYEEAVEILATKSPANRAKAERMLGRRLDALSKKGLTLRFDNPFYATRQLKDEVRALMPRGLGLSQAKPAMRSKLFRARDHDTVEEWVTAVVEAAKREASSDDEAMAIAREALEAGKVGNVAELDLAKLMLRYSDETSRTLGRAHLVKTAERLGVQESPEVVNYMTQVWGEAAPRGPVSRWIARFNKTFKPAVTVVWPSYHFRNLVSAIGQTALDPDLGTVDGVMAAARIVSDLPARKLAPSLGVSPDDAVAFMRAVDGDPAALRHVQGLTIAGRSGDEVFRGLVGGVVSKAGGQGDLFESVSMAERLGRPAPSDKAMPARLYENYKRFTYNAAGYVENSMRSHAYLKLVGKGVDPVDAAARVNRAFINYDTQSAADRTLRELFPFIRFPVAILPPVAEAAARSPGSLPMQFIRQSQAQGDQQSAEDKLGLPDYMRRGFRLPLGGGSYLGPLGLPQEAAAQFADTPLTGEGFRQTLAGLSPMLRAPLEAGIGMNLYTGSTWGSDRRAPPGAGFVPGLVKTHTAKDGTEYREVPGWVNELIRALPTARFTASLAMVADSEKSELDKLGRLVLGVNVVKPDQRRGIARAVARHMSRLYAQGKVGEARQHWARVAEGEEVPEGLAEAIRAEVSLKRK